MPENSPPFFSFEKLDVYQRSLTFSERAFAVSRDFPKEARFGLTSQFLRASDSIALNIAEGSSYSRAGFKDFLKRARGSAYECVAILSKARNRKYLNQPEYEVLYNELRDIARMLSGLIKKFG